MWSKNGHSPDSGGIPNDAVIGETSEFEQAWGKYYNSLKGNPNSVQTRMWCKEYFEAKIEAQASALDAANKELDRHKNLLRKQCNHSQDLSARIEELESRGSTDLIAEKYRLREKIAELEEANEDERELTYQAQMALIEAQSRVAELEAEYKSLMQLKDDYKTGFFNVSEKLEAEKAKTQKAIEALTKIDGATSHWVATEVTSEIEKSVHEMNVRIARETLAELQLDVAKQVMETHAPTLKKLAQKGEE